ncbi:MAG TPA: hypothetical protein ENK43_09410 [Planctomycetes bacterium]|nr:hypothetical protein [Planctomycetota bacterium]
MRCLAVLIALVAAAMGQETGQAVRPPAPRFRLHSRVEQLTEGRRMLLVVDRELELRPLDEKVVNLRFLAVSGTLILPGASRRFDTREKPPAKGEDAFAARWRAVVNHDLRLGLDDRSRPKSLSGLPDAAVKSGLSEAVLLDDLASWFVPRAPAGMPIPGAFEWSRAFRAAGLPVRLDFALEPVQGGAYWKAKGTLVGPSVKKSEGRLTFERPDGDLLPPRLDISLQALLEQPAGKGRSRLVTLRVTGSIRRL